MSSPEALQVRVCPEFRGRMAVGAPQPARAMSSEEVHANVLYFARVTPRTRPIRTLVLSGLGEVRLAEYVESWRAAGVARLVLHTSPSTNVEPELVAAADQRVVSVVATADLLTPLAASDSVVVALQSEIVAALPQVVAALKHVENVVWMWPFPVPGQPPPPSGPTVARALLAAGALARGWRVKGLPPCVLAHRELARTRNRFYVDADHQLERSMVFFPDLVRFTKPDSCRFCREDVRCDGVADAWWRAGLVGPLRPL